MRYWWVNQKQTHRHEIGGGYLWSPMRNRNGARNQFYENMKAASPTMRTLGARWRTCGWSLPSQGAPN